MKPSLRVLHIRRSLQRRVYVRFAQKIMLHQKVKPEKLHRDLLRLAWIAWILDPKLRHVNPAPAPGSWLYGFFRFVCSPKTFKRVYEPMFADMWDEYYKALKSCDEWKARWIIARTTMQLLTTICLSLGFSLMAKVVKMWKIGG